MLNKEKNRIYNVRGNCDAEVDQMVLEFPVLADYGWMEIDGKTFYMSHGHIYNEHNLPPLKPGDIFMHGHTHVLRAEKVGDIHDPESGFPCQFRRKGIHLPMQYWKTVDSPSKHSMKK